MILSQTYTQSLKKELHAYAEERRKLIADAGQALHHAKRVIFSLHRGDMTEARERHTNAENMLKAITKMHKKNSKLLSEGSLKAAMEEFVEASMFLNFVQKKPLGKITSVSIPAEVYIAGLADVPGELYRYAIRAATNGDIKTVHACNNLSSEIIGALIDIDLTSYLRTKVDQAKSAAQKLEHVVYELSLRK